MAQKCPALSAFEEPRFAIPLPVKDCESRFISSSAVVPFVSKCRFGNGHSASTPNDADLESNRLDRHNYPALSDQDQEVIRDTNEGTREVRLLKIDDVHERIREGRIQSKSD